MSKLLDEKIARWKDLEGRPEPLTQEEQLEYIKLFEELEAADVFDPPDGPLSRARLEMDELHAHVEKLESLGERISALPDEESK